MGRRRLSSVIVIALAVAACSGKKSENEPAPVDKSTPDTALKPATDAGAKPRRRSDKPTYTDTQRADYRRHLRAGRALAGRQQWGEAVVAFEAALAIIPMDPRVLSELGWAAFQAGDYDKAKKTNTDAVQVAGDRKLEAAGLYNLGRVAEATSDPEEATHLYRESLKLRPNRIVEKRLTDLGNKPREPAKVEPVDLPCTTAASREEVCACLRTDALHSPLSPDDKTAECVRRTHAVAGLESAAVSTEREEWFYLLGESKAGWAVVARLGHTYNPGKFGINEEYSLTKVEPKRVGKQRILWVEGHHARTSFDAVVNEEEVRAQNLVTLCVVPSRDSAAIWCPLQFPVVDDYVRQRVGDEELDETVKDLGTPDLPIDREVGLRVVFKDDGTVTLILVQGKKTSFIEPYLGPHKLW